MAATEVMLLSSPHCRTASIASSSPALPSPSQLLGGAKRRTYSPDILNLAGPDSVTGKLATVRRASEKRKYGSVGERDTPNEAVGALKSSRKPGRKSLKDATSAEGGNEVVGSTTQEVAKPKRSRVKQDGTQTNITKVKVTKPMLTGREKVAGAGSRKAGKGPIHSREHLETKDVRRGENSPLSASNDLCLEKALKRKTSWTPPKKTIAVLDLTGTTEGLLGEAVDTQKKEKENAGDSGNIYRGSGLDDEGTGSQGNRSFTATVPGKLLETRSKESEAGFRDICRAFGFEGMGNDLETAKSSSAPKSKTPNIQSRIKVNASLVLTTNIATDVNEQPKPKTKKPKKKAKTITEQATAAYAIGRPQSVEAPISNYFPHGTRVGDGHNSENTNSTGPRDSLSGVDAPHPPTKSCAKQKATKPKTNRKKNDPQTPAGLLSPRSANKQIEDQNFLFGTSSQLARQEPPALKRDSERLNNASEVSGVQSGKDIYESTRVPNSRGDEDRLLDFMTSRSLWSVAAGEGTESVAPEGPEDNGELAQGTVLADASCGLPASSQKEGESRDEANPHLVRPDFEGYATAQLASELASYGFKPTKNRKRMIALMQKCWEGKHRMALKALEANTQVPPPNHASAPSSGQMKCSKSGDTEAPQHGSAPGQGDAVTTLTPKRPRKRAKQIPPIDIAPPNLKRSSARTKGELYTVPESPLHDNIHAATTVERLTDFIAPSSLFSSHPAHGRHSPTPSAVSPTSSLATITVTSPAPDETARQARRFSRIAKAIRSEPPSTRSASPTWHERILMYDPIVLEDLAVWLNTQGLGAIGEDFEVGPAEVKAWCLQNSICCLSRENLWGNGRTRR